MKKASSIGMFVLAIVFLVGLVNVSASKYASSTEVMFFTAGNSTSNDTNPAISGLSAIEKTNHSILWNWTNPSTNFNGTLVVFDGKNTTLNSSQNQFLASDLKDDTTYTIFVYAINSTGSLSLPVNDSAKTSQTTHEDEHHGGGGGGNGGGLSSVQDIRNSVPTGKFVSQNNTVVTVNAPESSLKGSNYNYFWVNLILAILIILILLAMYLLISR